ncbi:MAG: IS110 family transposase [Candidatus Nanopelagicales bacterium]|nr:IS110 family transposase [Candidatus Nanopelagicales bacterium]
MSKMTHEPVEVVAGVDTHADTHTAAVLDMLGHRLGTREFPTTPAGNRRLLDWVQSHGTVTAAGVEGTGSYGAGLTRVLRAADVKVWEINRPDRATRRAKGKSDPIDAEAAAEAVLGGRIAGVPRSRDGVSEAIRVVHMVRRTAVKARTAALNTLGQLLVTAPDPLRGQLRNLTTGKRVRAAANLRPGPDLTDSVAATKTALRRVAKRILDLEAEIGEAKAELDALTQHAAPKLRALMGVGPDVAAQLLITAGGNPERLTSEGSFAALCGTAPRPASSGKIVRHRLNRGGDRQANRALHVIVLTRMRYDERTRQYVQRRTSEGLSTSEISRCLKRYIAREVHLILKQALQPQPQQIAA